MDTSKYCEKSLKNSKKPQKWAKHGIFGAFFDETWSVGDTFWAKKSKFSKFYISKSHFQLPPPTDADEDSPFTRRLFIYLQWMSAVTGSLAHGGNDVGNAIGCLVMIFIVYDSPLSFDKSTTEIPQWLLFYGGCGITAGLCLFGRRVIETMGKSLTRLTPSRAYCVEIMAAVTVMLALQVGIPVSTTEKIMSFEHFCFVFLF